MFETLWKNGEDNWKVGKTSQTISQLPALGPKHDKIKIEDNGR